MPPPGFQTRANIGEHERFLSFALGSRPGLQPFELSVEIHLLSMPADSPIQHQQPPIEFAPHPFNFAARDAHLAAHWHGLDAARLDPTPDGDRMQPQLMSGSSNT